MRYVLYSLSLFPFSPCGIVCRGREKSILGLRDSTRSSLLPGFLLFSPFFCSRLLLSALSSVNFWLLCSQNVGRRERERSGGKGWSGIPRGRCPCLLKTREEEEEEERKRRGEGNRRKSTGVPRLISKFRSGLTFKHGVGWIPAVLLVQLASAAQATLSRSLRLQSFNYACTVE